MPRIPHHRIPLFCLQQGDIELCVNTNPRMDLFLCLTPQPRTFFFFFFFSKLNCPDLLGAFPTWRCNIIVNNLHYLALPSFLPRSTWAVADLGGQFPLRGFSFGFERVVWAPKAVIKLTPSKALPAISKHTESTSRKKIQDMSFFESPSRGLYCLWWDNFFEFLFLGEAAAPELQQHL